MQNKKHTRKTRTMANIIDNSTAEAAEWKVESYDYQAGEVWPRRGQHILAQYDEDSVVVYQAFRPEIADYAVANQSFVGCPDYNPLRMTWIKTNFLWMMFRSRWASRPKQERVLVIFLRRERFDYYLSCARRKGSVQGELGTIRLQWDPDHFPDRSRHPYRRAVQLGLKGVKSFGNGNDILRIVDVTAFAHEHRSKGAMVYWWLPSACTSQRQTKRSLRLA